LLQDLRVDKYCALTLTLTLTVMPDLQTIQFLITVPK